MHLCYAKLVLRLTMSSIFIFMQFMQTDEDLVHFDWLLFASNFFYDFVHYKQPHFAGVAVLFIFFILLTFLLDSFLDFEKYILETAINMKHGCLYNLYFCHLDFSGLKLLVSINVNRRSENKLFFKM